ncbi:hypothetical protein [Pseudoduganella armeniaca]|nr:hypothetical protein [Pseudoduganella armeniaca]
MAPRREAVRLLAVVLVLCALCAWATLALLAPANVLAFANLFMLCQG